MKSLEVINSVLKSNCFNEVHHVKWCTIVLFYLFFKRISSAQYWRTKLKDFLPFCFLPRWITSVRIMWFLRPRVSLFFTRSRAKAKRIISNILTRPDVWRVKLPSVKLATMFSYRTIPGQVVTEIFVSASPIDPSPKWRTEIQTS